MKGKDAAPAGRSSPGYAVLYRLCPAQASAGEL